MAYSICAGRLQSGVCGGVPDMGVAGELSSALLLIWFSVFQLGGWEGTVDYIVG